MVSVFRPGAVAAIALAMAVAPAGSTAWALNHAAKQMGARNRVWPRGVMGDPQASIAIFDTGIDASHKGFSPGFIRNGDWNGKVIYWYDTFGGKLGTPNDRYTSMGSGHGTHAAGIAASGGFGVVDRSL